VAEFERISTMSRTLIAVVSTVALVFAVPSFAARGSRALAPSSAPAMGAAPQPISPQGALPAYAMAVTGEVVFSTPDELVVHTPTGIQRFVVTPDTQLAAGAAQGAVVTVRHTTEAGHARATVVTQQAKTTMNARTGQAGGVIAPAVEQPMDVAMNDAGPTSDAPVAPKSGQPAGSNTSMTDTGKPAGQNRPMVNRAPREPLHRLPKTATSLSLIGLTGLLALAGGPALRAVRS
jgi:hypothetical protein